MPQPSIYVRRVPQSAGKPAEVRSAFRGIKDAFGSPEVRGTTDIVTKRDKQSSI